MKNSKTLPVIISLGFLFVGLYYFQLLVDRLTRSSGLDGLIIFWIAMSLAANSLLVLFLVSTDKLTKFLLSSAWLIVFYYTVVYTIPTVSPFGGGIFGYALEATLYMYGAAIVFYLLLRKVKKSVWFLVFLQITVLLATFVWQGGFGRLLLVENRKTPVRVEKISFNGQIGLSPHIEEGKVYITVDETLVSIDTTGFSYRTVAVYRDPRYADWIEPMYSVVERHNGDLLVHYMYFDDKDNLAKTATFVHDEATGKKTWLYPNELIGLPDKDYETKTFQGYTLTLEKYRSGSITVEGKDVDTTVWQKEVRIWSKIYSKGFIVATDQELYFIDLTAVLKPM